MTHIHIAPVQQRTFRAEAVLEQAGVAVRFSGTADLTVKAHVDRFLCQVHAEACRIDVPAVSVDMSALEFINSSCLKAFVTWITTVQEMAQGRYQISFLFKPAREWQQRSVEALSRLGEEVVSTRPAPDGPGAPDDDRSAPIAAAAGAGHK
jgi:hypothetical protein